MEIALASAADLDMAKPLIPMAYERGGTLRVTAGVTTDELAK